MALMEWEESGSRIFRAAPASRRGLAGGCNFATLLSTLILSTKLLIGPHIEEQAQLRKASR